MVSGIWVSHCMTIYFSWADVFLLNSTLWFNSCACVTIVAKPPKTHCLEQIHTLPWIWGLEVTCLNKFTGLKLRFPQHCIVWRMWGKYISLPFTSIQSLSYLHYTLSSSPRAQLCWSFWFFFHLLLFSFFSYPCPGCLTWLYLTLLYKPVDSVPLLSLVISGPNLKYISLSINLIIVKMG